MSSELAETGQRFSLRALGLALAVGVVAELGLLWGSELAVPLAGVQLARLFLLGATASLLTGWTAFERPLAAGAIGHGAPTPPSAPERPSLASASAQAPRPIQAGPLLVAVLMTLAATLVQTIGNATMTILWAEAPLWLMLLTGVLGALLPLLALTLTTFALTPLDGRGIATIAVSTMLAFAGAGVTFAGMGGSHLPWLGPLIRAASIALTLFTLLSRFSIFETSSPSAPSAPATPSSPSPHSSPSAPSTPSTPSVRDRRAAMALAAEPLWRDALLGARLLRAAELTRLMVMVLVFLLGFALLPLGPAWLVPLLIGQDLALVFIALTTLLGLLRLSRIPAASGARGPALAGLALAITTLIQVVGAATVDFALVFGRPDPDLSVSLDTTARFSTLGTIVAVCLAILAIARSAEHPALGRRALMAAVFYLAATLCLTGAGQLGASASLAAVLLKLAALILFSAGFLRLVRALTEVGPLIENERRRALSHEFA